MSPKLSANFLNIYVKNLRPPAALFIIKPVIFSLFASFLIIPQSAIAEGNIYAEWLAGNTKYRGLLVNTDEPSSGLRFGYRLTPHIALELGYLDFDEFNQSWQYRYFDDINQQLSISAITLGVRFSKEFFNRFSGNWRIGLAYLDYDYRETGISSFPTLSYSTDRMDEDINIFFGFGLEYQLSSHFHLGIEYTPYSVDIDTGTETLDVSLDKTAIYLGIHF